MNLAKAGPSLRTRFLVSVIIYALAVLSLWLLYHTLANRAIRDSERERVILATDSLTRQVSAELERMSAAAAAITGSEYVFDFLRERETTAYYEKAGAVSEIIRRSAYPLTSADSVVAINGQGRYYRFSGGLSNQSLEILSSAFSSTGTVFAIREIDGTMFFCHSVPVIDYTEDTPARLGNILILTSLDRTSRMLDVGDSADRMVLMGNIVMLSNNPELEGLLDTEVDERYEAFLTVPVPGTNLSVAAAIPRDVLYPENTLFLIIAVASLGFMMAMVVIIYSYQSRYMIEPMTKIIAHIRTQGLMLRARSIELRDKGAEQVSDGHPDSELLTIDAVPMTGRGDFDGLITDINEMLDRTKEYNLAFIAEKQKLHDSEMARTNMRLGLLASQMDAHFVVNTLKSIKRLAETGRGTDAGEMTDYLAAILQHQHAGDALVNIFDDFMILEKYVDIMNMKFNGKFSVSYDVEDSLMTCKMPGFILQPVVENALTHGLQNKEGDARLVIKGYLREKSIVFEISDNGGGIAPDKLKAIQDALADISLRDFPQPGLRGVALLNTQRRIRIQCGGGYGISVSSEAGKGTAVTVTLPVVYDRK